MTEDKEEADSAKTKPPKPARKYQISLRYRVKLRNLRGKTLIYEDKITLAGVTGHEITVIGKITAAILLDGRSTQIQYPDTAPHLRNCR